MQLVDLQKYLAISQVSQPTWYREDDLLFITNHNGPTQLWIKPAQGEAHLLTPKSDYITQYIVDSDNDRIYFATNVGGSENYQIWRYQDGQAEAITHDPSVMNNLGSLRNQGRELILSTNARDGANFDLMQWDLEDNTWKCLVENNDHYLFPSAMSKDERYLLYRKMFALHDQPFELYDFQTGEHRPLFSEKGNYQNPVWQKDHAAFYYLTNAGSDFMRLCRYDLEEATSKTLIELAYDIDQFAVSEDESYIAVVVNEEGYSTVRLYDTDDWKQRHVSGIPSGNIMGGDRIAWSKDNQSLLFTFSSPDQPSQILKYHVDKDEVEVLVEAAIDPSLIGTFVTPELHHVESFDGVRVPYFIYYPQKDTQESQDEYPVLVEIHGGPESQSRTNFSWYYQYILAHGIAVVTPNVRGSTGYGKAYSNLDNVEKRLDSVMDIKYLVNDLVKNQGAHPDKIVASGGSYGGFMALSCAGRLPELFCGIVDRVGMFNLVTFLENTSDYRRSHRESEYGTLAHDRELLYEVSPVAAVDSIRGPLLISHGVNDPRVPVSEADQVVDYLQEKGVPVTYLRFSNEGHSIQRPDNKNTFYQELIRFLRSVMQLPQE